MKILTRMFQYVRKWFISALGRKLIVHCSQGNREQSANYTWNNTKTLRNVTVCTVLELEQCSYQKKDFILCGWSLSTIATASSKVVAATLASILIPPMRCWCCLMSWKDLLICVSWRSSWRFVVGARNSTNVTALSRWYSLLYTLTLVNRMNDVTATPFCQPLAK